MTWGNNSVFQILIIQGSQAVTGLFLYNGLGAPGNPPQFAAVASTVTQDPFGNAITSSKILIQGNVITESGGIFRTAAAAPLIQLDGPHNALLLYNAAAALTETVASITTSDGLGNTVQQGFTAYGSVNTTYASLIAAALQFHTSGDVASPQVTEIANAGLNLNSGTTAALTVEAIFTLNSAAAGVEPLSTLSAALELVNAAATPAVNSGGATAFGGGGQLRVIDGADGSNYTTQRLTVALVTGAITSTSAVTLATLTLSASRTYELTAWAVCTAGAAAGAIDIRIAAGTATFTSIDVSSVISGGITDPFVSHGTALPVDCLSQTMSNGSVYIAQVRVVLTVNAGGTILVQGRETIAGDSWTLTSGKAELWPT